MEFAGGWTFTATLSYSYDSHGNVTNIQSSDANGVSLGYGYDSLNRLANVSDAQVGVTAYGYDAVGNLSGYTYPNGVSSVHAYDSLNRLTNLSAINAQSSGVADYTYTVGLSGHRLTASESILSGTQPRTINRLYSYDSIYRLTGEQISGPGVTSALGYTHDAVGNRLSRTSTLAAVPPTTASYDGNDRLISDGYDPNGNTTAATLRDATSGTPYAIADQYDFEDRLINRNNGQIIVNYDGDGTRVAKTFLIH